MLTIDQLRRYWLPKNASRANNLSAAIHQLAVYNDSISLYQAIKLVIEEEVTPAANTDLSNTPAGSTVTVESSTGTDTILPAATTSLAGVMSATDKTNLTNLITLSGVAAGETDLGSFTGGIILDDRTIKQALQDLETALEDGTGLPLGDLTSTTNDITVTSGTNSVFVPTGVSITFNPGNVNLSELGGTLNLSQLASGGAASGDLLSFNGTNWVAATDPAIDHNSLSGLQGGQASQYYHLNSALYNVLTASSSNRVIGRYSGGSGVVQALTLPYSVTISGSGIQLTNDAASPGNEYYYGTDNTGTKGWYALPSLSSAVTSASDSADIDFTIIGNDITGVLIDTGVIDTTYGAVDSVASFTVDAKGRITAAADIPIVIISSQVSDLTETVQDTVGAMITAGSGVSVSYNDAAGTITIASSTTYSDEQVQDAVGTILTDSSNIDLTYTDAAPAITADLTDTTVTAGSYGNSAGSAYPQFTVDAKGRITAASNRAIQITSTAVTDFSEAVDDRVSTLLVAGTDITLTYSDVAGTLTINSTAAGAGGSGYDTIQEETVSLTNRTILNFTGAGITAVDNAISTRTDVSLDDTLNALAAYNTNGLLTQTAADTFTGRTITAGSAAITVADGDGVSGNPTIDLDASSVDINDFSGPLDAANGGTGLSALGSANQVIGMDAAGTALEYKTVSGTTNQITVTHGAGSVTLATPQDIHTVATPTFGILTLQGLGGFSQLNMTGASSNDIYMTGGPSSTISMSAIAPTINLVQASSGSSSSGHLKFEVNDGSATASGDRLGYITFFGRGAATTDILGASIKANAAALFTNTSAPSSLTFATSPSGTVVPVDRIIIQPSGEVELKSGVALRLYETDNTNYVAIVPPTLSANYTLTLPTTDGSTDQVLTTNGSGVLSWQDSSNLVDTFYTADGTLFLARTVTLDNSLTFDGSAIGGPDTFAVYMTDALLEIGAGAGQYVNLAVLDGSSNPAIYLDSSGLSLSSDLVLSLSGQDISIIASNLQLTLGSDATGDIFYRDSGGHFTRLPIGSAGEVLTVTGGLPSWEPAASGSSPAGTNYNLQYYNSGAFGADSNITVTPGAQMKLAVGTSTPAATIHARNHNSAGSATLLVENSSGNNIHNTLSSGYFQWGDNETLPRMYQSGTTGGSVSYTAGGVTLEGFFEPASTYEVFGLTHTSQSDATDGPFSVFKVTGTHNPSSGTGDYVSIKVAPTINQTGTHTGDGYGIQVAPTLTSIGDTYVAFFAAVDNASAYGFVQEGNNSINYFDGDTGIGTTTPSSKLEVVGGTTSTHFIGNSNTPSYTLGSSTIVGTGASLTLVGTDAGFEATLITGTVISSVGTMFTVTFDSAYDSSPIVVFSERDLNSATYSTTVKPYVNSTSTTNFTFNNIGTLTASTTYKWSFIVIGR